MKKVGIITCSREPNYGACLQAFATQKVLQDKGFDAEIINYSFEDEKSYRPFTHKNPKTILACMLFYRLRKSQYNAFDRFHIDYMNFTERRYLSYTDFISAANEYDILLTGSDQVWNPTLGIDIGITLQEFNNKAARKISYASSFGISNIPEPCRERYTKALSDFDAVSTREKQGSAIIKELTGTVVPVVLDPTMLLAKEKWSSFASGETPQESFILLYDMRHSKDLFEFTKKLARKHNCKIYALSRIEIFDKDIKTLHNISPSDMLTLFENASFVVTDSFHGTVFSILYHKSFFVQCAGEGMKLSSRITDLLLLVDLQNRLIGSDGFAPDLDIDYAWVDSILEDKRNVSLDYLVNALNGEEC